ncbi:hypothetical protein N7486_008700 [Penicillium sp. IBT 16267x]|nr:hypothetical protein N7486_008700 [Penicillium sp. IBT 16267x]
MWDYYEERSALVTGGSGFLGTAIVHRLFASTSTLRIYLVCRGGIEKLRARWLEWLPRILVEKICNSSRLIVLDGDILLPGLGLSEEVLSVVRDNTSIIIHAASSINLRSPLCHLFDIIVNASDMMVDLALTCKKLDRFIYVSTAYVNTYLYPKSDEIDVEISEKVYELTARYDVLEEVEEVRKHGTSRAYESENFPWAYAYAKHLTERLLQHRFAIHDSKEKLLIVRPSVIGPSQCLPFPGYIMPMSSPGTILAAALLLSPNRNIKIATKMQNPDLSTQDEVPVDVVTDRLLCHLALGTYGCVHAVSGVKSRMGLEEWRKQLLKLRRIPWGLQPQWIKEDWSSPNQHRVNQLYKILATSFAFSESKTMAILQELRGIALPDRQEEISDLQLFTRIDMSGLPKAARPLHHQKLLGRNIVITENANEHLVWHSSRILIKPLPEYLLCHDFWVNEGSALRRDQSLYQCACGMLLSYCWLISTKYDLVLAQEAHLLPSSVSWEAWVLFVTDLLTTIDSETLQGVSLRYHFGELRLSRLNLVYRLAPGVISRHNLVRGFLSKSSSSNEFLEHNFAWLFSVFGFVTIVGSSMQVGLGTGFLQDAWGFEGASVVFTVGSLVVATISVLLIGCAWAFLFVYHVLWARQYLQFVQQKRAKGSEKAQGA